MPLKSLSMEKECVIRESIIAVDDVPNFKLAISKGTD